MGFFSFFCFSDWMTLSKHKSNEGSRFFLRLKMDVRRPLNGNSELSRFWPPHREDLSVYWGRHSHILVKAGLFSCRGVWLVNCHCLHVIRVICSERSYLQYLETVGLEITFRSCLIYLCSSGSSELHLQQIFVIPLSV